jgi:hypothetical protein
MTQGFKLALIWIIGCVAALTVALAPISSTLVDHHYVPAGADAFYHARRILGAVADPASFFQFDRLMHAPQGSLVIWPWAYDWVMSLLVRAGLALHLSRDPMAILVNLPPAGFVLAQTLVLAICRSLRLGLGATLLALLATAFFPLNQLNFQIGNFHHHYAEQLFLLASLACGLAWLRTPESRSFACLTGIVLGLSVGVHTAQFILQIPLLAGLLWLWARGTALPRHLTLFAGTVILATLLVALPSLPLREGHFEFYTLSWFQVYCATCTAILCVLLSRLPFNARNAWILGVAMLVMAGVIIGQVLFAGRFFTNAISGMGDIGEVQSPWHTLHSPGGIEHVAREYTLLIFLAPVTLLMCLWRLWRDQQAERALFWIACILGLVLLLQQLRLNYYGSFALYLPWLLLADGLARRRPARVPVVLGVLGCALAAIYWPAFADNLFARRNLANDPIYEVTRQIYPAFAAACAQHPGIALAEPSDGHYIRFHTDCAVIANNFLVTPLQEQKTLEEQHLLSLPAAQLPQTAPYVSYVYVRRAHLFYVLPNDDLVPAPKDLPGYPDLPLVKELLDAPPTQLPPHFRLLKELFFPGHADAPYARLFAVDRD